MRIGIIGSRAFSNYELMSQIITTRINIDEVELIVSGGAIGADKLGELFANNHNIPVKIFYPDWKTHGKSAGFVRNRLIIENSDIVIAFWDGQSKGTKHSIDLANKLNKSAIIVSF